MARRAEERYCVVEERTKTLSSVGSSSAFVAYCLIRFLRCVAAPGIVLCEFALLKVIAELRDRNRATMNP